MRRKAHTK